MSETTITSEAPAAEQGKTVTVTVQFRLSPEGQKAAVIAGKPAAKDQEITGPVSVDLLPLCEIQDDGSVVATFRSGIWIGERGTVRAGTWASYHPDLHAPPESAEAVLVHVRDGLAAKCAEVKADYERRQAEQREREAKQEAEYQSWLAATQRTLDADPEALPSTINVPHRHYTWAKESDDPVAVEIRRRQKVKENREKAAAVEAAEAKQSFVRGWLVEHGTEDQVERFEAGLLSEKEYVGAMAEHAFAPLDAALLDDMMAEDPRRDRETMIHNRVIYYQKITPREVHAVADGDDDEYAAYEAKFRSTDATELSADQWKQLKAMRAALPAATIKPRLHEGTLDSDDVPWGVVSRLAALAVMQVGPIEVRREYAL